MKIRETAVYANVLSLMATTLQQQGDRISAAVCGAQAAMVERKVEEMEKLEKLAKLEKEEAAKEEAAKEEPAKEEATEEAKEANGSKQPWKQVYKKEPIFVRDFADT